ncbi:hypothetical protein [Desulfofundulus thermocisternus]|nr:hypothetical protein [Desulfofundulus thermocisternus]
MTATDVGLVTLAVWPGVGLEQKTQDLHGLARGDTYIGGKIKLTGFAR